MTKYRADIDGLRAIAVLAVVIYHAGVTALGGGFVGVDVFFVISGYVITRRLLDDARAGRYSIADFYVRRIRRIFPALFCMVLVTWGIAAFLFLPDQFEDLSKSTAATGLFVSNLYFWRHSGYFDASALLRPLLHTWSLAVEEQYYIFMPLAVFAVARFGKQRWALCFIPVALASLTLSILATKVAPTANFFLLPTRAWELLLGALLVMAPLPQLRSRMGAEAVGAVAFGLILYAVFAFTEDTAFPGLNALFPCVGAAALIYLGEGHHRTAATRLLALTPLVWIGLISYSMYLWHWPITVFARHLLLRDFTAADTVMLIVASGVLGYLSYRFIEQPFRHPRPDARSAGVLWGGAGAMAVIAAVGALGVALKGLPQRFPDFQRIEIAGTEQWMERTCFLGANQTWRAWDPTACTRTGGLDTNMLLWGDSFAAHYVPGLISHSTDLPGNLVQYTAAGCRPIFEFFSYSLPNCHDFNSRVPQIIRSMKIKTVVIAARWQKLGSRGFTGLQQTVEALRDLGVKVYVVGQSPEFPIDVQSLAYRQSRAGAQPPGNWPSAVHPKVNQELQEVVSGIASYIDPIAKLCEAQTCQYIRDGKFLYEDYGHLSAAGSSLAVARYLTRAQLPNPRSANVTDEGAVP